MSVKMCAGKMDDLQGDNDATGAGRKTAGEKGIVTGTCFLLIITHASEAATSDSNRLARRSSRRERPLLA